MLLIYSKLWGCLSIKKPTGTFANEEYSWLEGRPPLGWLDCSGESQQSLPTPLAGGAGAQAGPVSAGRELGVGSLGPGLLFSTRRRCAACT